MNEPMRVSRLFEALRLQHRSAFYSLAKRRRLAAWKLAMTATTERRFSMPITSPYILDIALLCAVAFGFLLGSMLPDAWAVPVVFLCGVLLVVFIRRLRSRGRFRDRGE